jgi:hypothetical protein
VIIVIGPTGVSVEQADDLGRFHVAAPTGADVDAALRSAGFGSLDVTGQAWIDVATLRGAARAMVDDDTWPERFDQMLAYAASRGWLDAAGTSIGAHIETHG